MVRASCLSNTFWRCQVAHVTTEFYLLFSKGINLSLPFLYGCQLSEKLDGFSYLSDFFYSCFKLPNEFKSYQGQTKVKI